jgi:hypothetical protein
MNVETCRKSLNEWKNNVTRTAVEKNWRKLWFTIDEAYTVLHICSDVDETGYQMLVDHMLVTLAKLMFGYVYTDSILYGEYLIRLLRPNDTAPVNVIEQIHEIANNTKTDVTIDDIKQYAIKLLTSIINYFYNPY